MKMQYQIKIFPNGQASLLDLEAGETMHSTIGPWQEALGVYVEPSRLEERFFTDLKFKDKKSKMEEEFK